MKESDWQTKAVKMYLQKHQGMVDTTAADTDGGKFIVESSKSTENSKTSRAVFMVEKGPTQYHVAYYITYTLDRMLGVNILFYDMGCYLYQSVRFMLRIIF